MIEILAQIRASKPRQFTAGIVLWNDIVIEAAPVLHFMKRGGWTRDRVRKHCETKGWEISIVHQMRRGAGAEAATKGRT